MIFARIVASNGDMTKHLKLQPIPRRPRPFAPKPQTTFLSSRLPRAPPCPCDPHAKPAILGQGIWPSAHGDQHGGFIGFRPLL